MADGGLSTPQMATLGILFVMVLSGPAGGIDFARDRPSLGDGTASVTVVEPDNETILITDGRFGTNVSYVRIPDLVVDVTSVDGQPRVFYQIVIPEMNIKKQNDRIVRSTGRLRVPISDRAVPNRAATDTTARLVVRVQSFTGGHEAMNRTVRVRQRG